MQADVLAAILKENLEGRTVRVNGASFTVRKVFPDGNHVLLQTSYPSGGYQVPATEFDLVSGVDGVGFSLMGAGSSLTFWYACPHENTVVETIGRDAHITGGECDESLVDQESAWTVEPSFPDGNLEFWRKGQFFRRNLKGNTQPNLPAALDSLVGSSELLGCHQEFG